MANLFVSFLHKVMRLIVIYHVLINIIIFFQVFLNQRDHIERASPVIVYGFTKLLVLDQEI